jgi:hypothetical protein
LSALLYDALARTELHKDLSKLNEPSGEPEDDPILGAQPEIVYRWNTFTRKHGPLIEKVMTDVIQHARGWQPQGQTHFSFGTKKTATHLIDRIAINRANEVAVFIECKRNLGKVPSDAQKRIRAYDRWCQEYSKDIASMLGFKSGKPLIRFAIFNAYGKDTDKNKIKGIPVLMPEDLPKIFDLSVYQTFLDLNAEVTSVVCKHEDLWPFLPKAELPSAISIELGASQPDQNEDPEKFRRRINLTLDELMCPKG